MLAAVSVLRRWKVLEAPLVLWKATMRRQGWNQIDHPGHVINIRGESHSLHALAAVEAEGHIVMART